MNYTVLRKWGVVMAFALLTTVLVQGYAEARAGGSRSSGSRGSRSYSQPASPSTSPSRQQAQQPRSMQQPSPAGGGFLRSMAGGIVGGMLGGMLFRSLGFGGGMGGGMGGGIGLFEILLIGGIIYFIYRMIKKRREAAAGYQSGYEPQQLEPQPTYSQPMPPAFAEPDNDLAAGIAHIRQMDASFAEERFSDQAMDLFFRIQGAWMHRDLAPVQSILTDEMRSIMQTDLDELKRQGRINRLENIAVRTVEIVEAWQEQGQDFVTARVYANLLDYTTDEAGKVLEGSTTEPVKFEEFWTFSRPVGPNHWRLSGINQK